jgi:hypothetical protein
MMLPCSAVAASDAMKSMDHSAHVGKKIHEADVQGYRLAYHLLDLPGDHFQHLMVYIIGPKGEPVTEGKVGYLIEGPDGGKQRVMAASMKEAYGGNVNLQSKGSFQIKTKAVFGNKKLLDQFTYDVK